MITVQVQVQVDQVWYDMLFKLAIGIISLINLNGPVVYVTTCKSRVWTGVCRLRVFRDPMKIIKNISNKRKIV
jgi:hypothetical protein